MKLISLNIERDKHLDRVLPFLGKENPDVVCLQELYERDVEFFEHELGMRSVYEALELWDDADPKPLGIGIFSLHPIVNVRREYYYGGSGNLRLENGDPASAHNCLLTADIAADGDACHLGATHFTWSPNGEPSGAQRERLEKLLKILEQLPEIIFCGDFNAPRGDEIWNKLAAQYADWIPKEYTSSIDGQFHRAGVLSYLVDGLFSTPAYRAANVRLVSGVSDHMAIVADITPKLIPYLSSN